MRHNMITHVHQVRQSAAHTGIVTSRGMKPPLRVLQGARASAQMMEASQLVAPQGEAPVGPTRSTHTGKRPLGSHGENLVVLSNSLNIVDVTVVHPCTASYINAAASTAGATAERLEREKLPLPT